MKARIGKLYLSRAALAVSIMFPTASYAEEADAPKVEQRDEIVVTARRTNERLQDVPIAISALNTEGLQQRAVRDVYDLQQATPGLSVSTTQSQGRSGGGYNIRGQGQSADDAPPGVVTYLNDVPAYGPSIARAFYDIELLQVLKGPQGTLFGKNTNGGAILINSAKPTDEFEGYLTARYGNLDARYVEGAVNLPLASGLALRVAGNLERRDGFTRNELGPDLDNVRYENLRASLRLAPTGSGFENLLVFSYNLSNERGPGYNVSQVFSNPAVLQGGTLSAPRLAALSAALNRGPRDVAIAEPGFSRASGFGVSNTTTAELSDNWTLKNIAAYQQLKYEGQQDYDNTDLDFLSVGYARKYKQITNELQFQGSLADGRVNLILGGFFLGEQQDPVNGRTRFGATNAGYVLTPDFFYNLQFIHQDQTSKALFAQATVKITDTVNITAGYRYTWDKYSIQDNHQRYFVDGTVALPPQVPLPFTSCAFDPTVADPDPRFTMNFASCQRTGEAKSSASNYNITLDYKPSDDFMVYIAHRHGYKAGGFNTTSAFHGYGNIFEPEKVDDVEGGLKLSGAVGGGRYSINVSAFHSWYDGLQFTQVIDDASGPQSLTQNTGRARLWGGDVDVMVEPVQGLSLTASYAYFDGKFTRQDGVVIGALGLPVDLVGLRYRTQPKSRWTFGAAYRHELGGDSEINASTFVSHSSGYYRTYDVFPGNYIPKYTLVNARIGISNIAGSGVDLAAFGKNLTNRDYIVGVSNGQTFGFLSRLYGEPRTYGVEASIRF